MEEAKKPFGRTFKSKSSTTTELRVTYVWLLGIVQDQRGEVCYLMLLMRDVLEEDILSM